MLEKPKEYRTSYLNYVIHIAKLKGSFQENTSSSIPRFDGGESGHCCEFTCFPLRDCSQFEDTGCLRSIYLYYSSFLLSAVDAVG